MRKMGLVKNHAQNKWHTNTILFFELFSHMRSTLNNTKVRNVQHYATRAAQVEIRVNHATKWTVLVISKVF